MRSLRCLSWPGGHRAGSTRLGYRPRAVRSATEMEKGHFAPRKRERFHNNVRLGLTRYLRGETDNDGGVGASPRHRRAKVATLRKPNFGSAARRIIKFWFRREGACAADG